MGHSSSEYYSEVAQAFHSKRREDTTESIYCLTLVTP